MTLLREKVHHGRGDGDVDECRCDSQGDFDALPGPFERDIEAYDGVLTSIRGSDSTSTEVAW